MISFKDHWKKSTWNPANWFRTPEAEKQISEEDRISRTEARKNAHKYIRELKDVLKQRGYIIHKHDYSYTVRKQRKVGMSPTDSSREKIKFNDDLLNIPYIKTLFALAHEVGHVLQWNEETNTQERFREFYENEQNIKDYYDRLDLESLHKLWYELDAWVRGMQFVPMEYKPQYKKYAFHAYKTYMGNYPRYYMSEMLLRNILIDLNMQDNL